MGLLAPLFMAGLLAVAIPIIVHLVHRERKEPLAFPSLMFLRRVPFRSEKRQRIRYWLLFLLRTAALVLIATAFARPWIRRDSPGGAAVRGGKDIVVLVDRSYSMGAREVQARARDAGGDAVASAGETDRVAVIAFGEQAELLTRLDDPRGNAAAAVQGIEPTSDVTRYAPAFRLAGTVLGNSRGPAEIIVITDRQRSGWRNIEQVAVPQNTTVRVIDVSMSEARNVAVGNVNLSRSTVAGRERVVPTARILNRGDSDVSVTVQLRIGDRVQQVRNANVKARSSTDVTFDAMFAGSLVGDVRIDARDGMPADDVAYFTTASGGVPAVRIVSGNADASFYFENALTAGDAGSFEVHRSTARLTAADLQATNVLVMLEAPLTANSEVEEFVRQGGGLVVIGTAVSRGSDLLPLNSASLVQNEDAPASLVSIDAAHPVFEPFRASDAQAFASARFNRHLRGEAAEGANIIARFDDGAPALLERRFGRGRVVHWTSGLTRAAGDFVLQPAFVPFVQQLVKHAASGAKAQKAFTVGNVIDVNAFAPADREAVVLTPTRDRIRLAAAKTSRTVRIAEPGIYQIRAAGEGGVTQMIAANVDVSESDLATIEVSAFNDAIAPRGSQTATAAAQLLPEDRESQQSLWWYLLIIAFVLLAIETLMANRISTAWRT